MLVLLPPSEGKTAPRRGAPLDLGRLSFPGLTATRRVVLDDLVSLCSGDADQARSTLGLSPGLAAEVDRNAALITAPTAPAGRVYTGVLYDALAWPTLDAAARRRAQRWLAIASAAFGLVRPNDRIPAYRLSGDVTLPRVGPLSAAWRGPLAEAIRSAAGRGVVLDLRSGAYVALGPVPSDLADRTVTARVLLERDGRRSVVSHSNKATKGRLVRHLLERGDDARGPEDLAGLLGSLGYRVELAAPSRDARPWTLDVVVDAV